MTLEQLDDVNNQQHLSLNELELTEEATTNAPLENTESQQEKKPRPILSFFNQLKELGDGYGASALGPQLRRKTYMGMLMTTVFRLAILALVIYNIYLLARPNRLIVPGEMISLNALTALNSDRMSVPTLEIKVGQKILFYEKESSSLQRITIRDKHGFEKILSSKKQGESEYIPIARGMHSKHSVLINTFDQQTLQPYAARSIRDRVIGKNTQNTGSMDESGIASAIQSPLIDDTLMLVHLNENVFTSGTSSFVPHTAHLFVRFKQEEISLVKPCQLQVGLVNSVQYDLLTVKDPQTGNNYVPKSYQSKEFMTSYQTTNKSWAFDYYTSHLSDINLVTLSTKVTQQEYEQFKQQESYGDLSFNIKHRINETYGSDISQFMNYKFFVNYMNTFQYTHNSYLCDSIEVNSYTEARNFLNSDFKGIALDGTQDYMFIRFLAPTLTKVKLLKSFILPFDIILSGVTGVTETVTAIAIESLPARPSNDTNGSGGWAKLKLKRTNPVNFLELEPQVRWFASTQKQLKQMLEQDVNVLPDTVPAEWYGDWCGGYNDGIVCDCGCGAPDPDCARIMPTIFENIENYDNLTNIRLGAYAYLCDAEGNSFIPPMVHVSKICDNSARRIGQKELIGFFGTGDDFANSGGHKCTSCPSDSLFNGESRYSDEKEQNVCGNSFIGTLDLSSEFKSDLDCELFDGSTKCKCVYLTVRIPNGHDPFPTDPAKMGSRLKFTTKGSGSLDDIRVLNTRPVQRTYKFIEGEDVVYGGTYDYQQLCVQSTGQYKSYFESTLSMGFGTVLSAINSQTTSIIVRNWPTRQYGDPWDLVEAWYWTRLGKFKNNPGSDGFTVSLFQDGYPIVDESSGLDLLLDVASIVSFDSDSMDDIQILLLKKPPTIDIASSSFGFSGEIVSISSDKQCATVLQNKYLPIELPFEVVIRRMDIMAQFELLNVTSINEIDTTTIELCFSEPIQGLYYPRDRIESGGIQIAMSEISVSISDATRIEYLPSDLYKMNDSSPDVLNFDAALFVVPDRPLFTDKEFNLCPYEHPNEPVVKRNFSQGVFSRYQIKSDRQHKIQHCSFTDFPQGVCIDTEDLEKNTFNSHCISEMPPSKVLEFDHVSQMNNKWKLDSDDINSIKSLRHSDRIDPGMILVVFKLSTLY
jgi:hypothetical protein